MERLTDWNCLPCWQGPFEFALENGLRVIFAQREESPIVEVRLVIEGGFAEDPSRGSGLAALATAMFSEGLLRVGDTPLGTALEPLGALTYGQVMADAVVVGISALNQNLDEALRIFADTIKYPDFKTGDFELLQANRLALIAGERLNPFEVALRVLPSLVYGVGHVYARPFTGSGNETDVAAITCDKLHSYYATHLAPQHTTLVVAGSGGDLRTRLEEAFSGWRSASAAPAFPTAVAKIIGPASSITIINRPGTSQTMLAAGLRTVARSSSHAEALMVADTILGGIFTSRLNLSLRERKGLTYGVRSSLLDTRRQGLWLIRTAVRIGCAAQAMAEVAGEIENLAGRRPSTLDEFSRAVDYLVARIPSSYETCSQMADALAQCIIYLLPVSYPQQLASRMRRLGPAKVTEICRRILNTGGPRWMVVGEAAELVAQLHDAGFRNTEVIEPDSGRVP
jgi:zinc protease